MSWIDISVPLKNGMVHWPGDPAFQSRLAKTLGGDCPCNLTHLDMSAHTGTHMDAPRHFIADGKTMEAMPIDATVGPCRVIEIHHDTAITAALLLAGADVNVADENGETPLLLASAGGHLGPVRLLLDRGAEVDAKDAKRRTALIRPRRRP